MTGPDAPDPAVEPATGDAHPVVQRPPGDVDVVVEPSTGDVDPVVERYKRDIDRTLIRENLTRSVEERLERLMELQRFAIELREAGRRAAPG